METKKNGMLELVETMMDRQKDQLEQLQAENLIELRANKEQTITELDKVTSSLKDLKTNISEVETKMVKNTLKSATNLNGAVGIKLNSADVKGKLTEKANGAKGINIAFDAPLLTNAAINIHDPASFTAGLAPVVLPFREMGVDKAPVRPLSVSELISWGTTTSNSVDWIERTSKTSGEAMRAEDGKMGQGDLGYTEVSTKVKIASEYMKVTNESLKDVDFLASEINSELLSDLKLLVDNQLLTGDGTGTNLLGIIPQSTAFAAGAFATKVIEPNNADVLRVAINQILVASNGKWLPSHILMHPTDVATLDLLKIADGRYIEVPYYSAEGQTVVRVPIVQNVGITLGEFLVGAFPAAKGFVRDALTVRVFDQNEDDPLYNRSTVTANVRLAFRIKNQEKIAFVNGVFATAITALKKV